MCFFERATRDKHYVLYHLFPDRKTELEYYLRRRHQLTLTSKIGQLANCHLIIDYFTKTVTDMTRM